MCTKQKAAVSPTMNGPHACSQRRQRMGQTREHAGEQLREGQANGHNAENHRMGRGRKACFFFMCALRVNGGVCGCCSLCLVGYGAEGEAL
jgi:hypothetical protein